MVVVKLERHIVLIFQEKTHINLVMYPIRLVRSDKELGRRNGMIVHVVVLLRFPQRVMVLVELVNVQRTIRVFVRIGCPWIVK